MSQLIIAPFITEGNYIFVILYLSLYIIGDVRVSDRPQLHEIDIS